MKRINPKILLIAVGIIAIVAVSAHYGGSTLAVSECYHYFSAQDEDGDPMPFMTHYAFYELIDGVWEVRGRYHMPTNTIGSPLWLRSDTRYKAIPESYSGWKTPLEQTFYGCSKDCVFVFKRIVCTPGVTECEGDALYKCNSDGTAMVFQQTCPNGCSAGACIAPPPVPCSGLPECSSITGWYQECCDDKVWTCYWNNYDGAGYRFQWGLDDTCDADCTCNGATSEQECWCADLTPDCSGLGVCDNGVYLCDACCDGDVWECRGHYKWELKESCTEDETCECNWGECLDCDCETIATPTPTPTPSPAQIDDATDTLTFDKTSYQIGETVNMYATGTNIGGEEWHGKVTFTITQPDGSMYTVKESGGINVAAGSSATTDESFILPTTGQGGTWTAQSKWITDEGVTDARSSILDLGESDAEDNTIWIIGGIAVFLLLLYFAFRKTKR